MPKPRKPRPATGPETLLPATLAWFVMFAGGQVTLGHVPPLGCTVIAQDGRHTRVALKRRSGESLTRLLLRFDEALVRALDGNAVVDEINSRR
jgi:hypothetical protein